MGRSRAAGLRCDPEIRWFACDLARAEVSDWTKILTGADVVVNASGALQDGSHDSLAGIHETALARMVDALQGRPTRVIQITAAGVSEQASTEFLRSKARGAAHLMHSGLDWVILRPTLVIGARTYGGTALLRAAAAFPVLFPRVLPGSPIQTVWVEDVAGAVLHAARSQIAGGSVLDLTEVRARSFPKTALAVRRWQGFPAWKASLPAPRPPLRTLAWGADLWDGPAGVPPSDNRDPDSGGRRRR